MNFLTRFFLLVALLRAGALLAQPNITQAEYFFDTDPGFGNGIPINITSPSPNVVLNFTPNIAGLSEGFHNLYVRGKDANGFWSLVHARTFQKLATPTSPTISSINPTSGLVGSSVVITGTNFSPLLANNTVRFNGVQATVTNASSTSLTVTVPPGATTGFITVTVGGLNGNSGSNFTVILPNITALEYFFNNDPGPGNGTAITITPGTNIDLTNINIPTTSLPIGWHTLCVRARDANNVWGFYECRRIYVRETPPIIPTPTVSDITQVEFFYNTDNGPGTGATIPISAGQNIDVVNTNLANTLPLGWHTVHVRAKNQNNDWGFYESRRIFVRGAPEPCCTPPSPITELEWFVDSDPGVGLSSTKLVINPSQTNLDLTDQPLDVGAQSLGAHQIYVRAKNADGAWSMTEAASFSVITGCPILNAPSATGLNRCDPGTVTLTAAGASVGETYRWYATNTSLTPLFTGNPFTTPVISVNTTYYVSAYNPTTFCESGRTPVTAGVSGIPKPTLNVTGSLAVCEGVSQVLTAPSGFSSYTWSNGLTNQQITVNTTGTYSVVVNNGICSSPPSDAFNFTVNSKPTKPTISGTGGGSLCGSGSVTLSAPAGSSGYTWSSGETTQNITVTSTGNYSVIVTNAAGCQSIASDVFTVTNANPTKPSITITGSTSLCDGSTVQLSAPSGFGSYAWSNGQTSQNITVSAAGTYTVIVSNGSCSSISSDPVSVSSSSTPSKPAITVNGNTSLCNGAFAVLSAPTGFSNYVWSNGETTRQIVVTNAGNYSVQTGNLSNCLSPTSDNVSITLTGQSCAGATPPAAPSTNNASRCGDGQLSLTASGASAGQEYRWYDALSGGNLLAATASLTIANLTQTTDYYVAVYDPITLLESSRIKTTATVVKLSKPTLQPGVGVTLCSGSTVTVDAPAGFSLYRWRRNGIVLNSTSQQLLISSGGNYTVETSDGTCYSPLSDELVITIITPPAKPIISGNNVICGSGTVKLTASGSGTYLWSTNETTQSINVTAGTYTVSISNGSCFTTSDPFVVASLAIPIKPSISFVGREFICAGAVVALTAPQGFTNYEWSTGATTQTILVDKNDAYTVKVGQDKNCLSVASDPKEVKLGTIQQCGIIPSATNRPPIIKPFTFGVPINGSSKHPLLDLISDADENLDLTTLQVVEQPSINGKASGGKARIDSDYQLEIDYTGLAFAGKENLPLRICDLAGLCIQQVMIIDVVGDVVVYNGITPDGDGINDFMRIQFIDVLEGANKNTVTILDRWGEVVFEVEDYDNQTQVFSGNSSSGSQLPSGIYLYKVVLSNGKKYTGFITLKR